MTVLDVGQGLAAVVETHALRAALRHGPALHRDSRRRRPHRRAVPARAGLPARSTASIVTHQDIDHSGGALSLLAHGAGRLVRVVAARRHRDRRASRADGARRDRAARRDSAGRGTACASTVLQPTAAHYATPRLKPNDLFLRRARRVGAGSVLLTGDLEARGETRARSPRPGGASAPMCCVVPHHGSRTSSTPAFIAAVAPRIAVFTPGYRNRFGHPRPDVVARYDDAGTSAATVPIYDGALTFVFAPDVPQRRASERDARPALLARGAAARRRRAARVRALTRDRARSVDCARHARSTRRVLARAFCCAVALVADGVDGIGAGKPCKAARVEAVDRVGPAFALGKAGERWAQLITRKRRARSRCGSFRARSSRSAIRCASSARCATARPTSPSARARTGRRRCTAPVRRLAVDRAGCRRQLEALASGRDEGALRCGGRARRRRPARLRAARRSARSRRRAKALPSPRRRSRGPRGARRVDRRSSIERSRRLARAAESMAFADAQDAFSRGHARRAGGHGGDLRRDARRGARANSSRPLGRGRRGRRVRGESAERGTAGARAAARARRATPRSEAARELAPLAREDEAALAELRQAAASRSTRLTAPAARVRRACARRRRPVWPKWTSPDRRRSRRPRRRGRGDARCRVIAR